MPGRKYLGRGGPLTSRTRLTLANKSVADLVHVVDVSDTTDSSGGTSKYMTVGDLTNSINNVSVSSQTPFASDTYLVGSKIAIPAGYPVIGTTYKCIFDVTKTGAGIAAPTLILRIGTLGTTGDAAICTIAFGAGTAVIDTGIFELLATFRTVGAGTVAVVQSFAKLVNNLTITGLSNAVKAKAVTSAGFNSTTAALQVGVSYNGGASAAHTIQLVRSELVL